MPAERSLPAPASSPWLLAIACVALAFASLVLPFAPAYDPWGWLVWGRELGAFELDTGAGPSWKPLPVAITAILAPAGDAAPDLWLAVARVGWLAALALAWRLAARLARAAGEGRALAAVAGAVAATSLLLIDDPFSPWLRQFAGGFSEPLLGALALAAIDRHLDGRRGQALTALTAASLLRPEAWPFLAGYAVWAVGREPRLRRPALGVGGLVALAWFVPDLFGAGDPLAGAERAREGSGAPVGEALEVLGRAWESALVGAWLLAAAAVWARARRGDRRPGGLALVAGAWVAIVAVMAAAGFAGLPRFLVPAIAIVCVLAGLGAAVLARVWIDAVRGTPGAARGAAALAAGVVAIGALAAGAIPRVSSLADDYREAEGLREYSDAVLAVADEAAAAVDRGAAAACAGVETDAFLARTVLAWKLEVAIEDVGYASRPSRDVALGVASPGGRWERDGLTAGLGRPLAEADGWTAYGACPAASARVSAASGRAIAGVVGAAR